MTSVIGLDHGRRRIGVAIADLDVGMAFARPALRVRGQDEALRAVRALCEVEGAAALVIGLPRNMDGSEGPQAAEVRSFGAALVAAGMAVTYVDERLTTWAAGEEEPARRDRRSRAGGELDSAAARLILQDYLDARSAQPSGPDGRTAGGEAAGAPPASAGLHDQEVG